MAPIKNFKTKMSKVRVINRSPFPLPKYQSDHAAGLDLQAVLEAPIALEPLQRELIKTGIFLALPEGTEAQVRPRSGLAYKKGLTVLNSPGTIDADYRGEVGVILVNLSNEPVKIEPGERIAQLVLARYERIDWEAVEALDDTARCSGGFGSTGV
jgi:dUTP pyrophosphatase